MEFFFLKSILVTFLISAAKYIIKKNLRGGRIYSGLQLKKIPSTVAREGWRQEPEAADHMASTGTKHSEDRVRKLAASQWYTRSSNTALSKVPTISKSAPLAGHSVFKPLSPQRAFHSLTTAPLPTMVQSLSKLKLNWNVVYRIWWHTKGISGDPSVRLVLWPSR